jgi:hypothetical protein
VTRHRLTGNGDDPFIGASNFRLDDGMKIKPRSGTPLLMHSESTGE